MTDRIAIYCLLVNKAGEVRGAPFKVKIAKDDDVSDLKDKIKKKKSNDLRNIDANKLTLRGVDENVATALKQFFAEKEGSRKLKVTSKIEAAFSGIHQPKPDYIRACHAARRCR